MCKEKHAIGAYFYHRNVFEVRKITGEMVKFPVKPYIGYWNVAWQWEIQEAFFETNNIKPIWINANYTYGILDFATGQWSGATGMIQRDEVDYAIFGFAAGSLLNKVSDHFPVDYLPQHWLTRYPLELTPTWNLLGLFTKEYFTNKLSINVTVI